MNSRNDSLIYWFDWEIFIIKNQEQQKKENEYNSFLNLIKYHKLDIEAEKYEEKIRYLVSNLENKHIIPKKILETIRSFEKKIEEIWETQTTLFDNITLQ